MKLNLKKADPGEDRELTSCRYKKKILAYYEAKAIEASKSGRAVSRNRVMEAVLEKVMNDPNFRLDDEDLYGSVKNS